MNWSMVTRVREWFRIAVLLGVAALSLMLPLSAPVQAAQGSGVIVVRSDRGGVLGERNAVIHRLQATGQRVELRGTCYSACTMYLGLANACVDPGAEFGFHGPSSYGTPLPPAQFEYWSQVMAAGYNAQLYNWYMQTARYTISGYYRLSGADLIRMGYQRC